MSAPSRSATTAWKHLAIIVRSILPMRWFSKELGLIVLQLLLPICYAWCCNFIANHTGNVLTAIVTQNWISLYEISTRIVLAAVLGAGVNSVTLSIGDILCDECFRRSLTDFLFDKYMQDETFYYLTFVAGDSAQDPGLRIVRDVSVFCTKLKVVLFGASTSVGLICMATTVVYFSSTLLLQCGWFVPCAVYLVFVTSSVTSKLLAMGSSHTASPSLSSKVQSPAPRRSSFPRGLARRKADFASRAEYMDFLRGELQEALDISHNLTATFPQVRRAALLHFPQNAWTILFYWGSTFYAYFIPAIAWLWLGDMQYTDYTRLLNVATVAVSLLAMLASCIQMSNDAAELLTTVVCIGELVGAMDTCQAMRQRHQHAEVLASDPNGGVQLRGVTLYRLEDPHRVLLEDVSFEVSSGRSVVIVGPSGSGKSSLLRAIAGLWPASGVIHRPLEFGHRGFMFLPQWPHFSIGSLRAQIASLPHSAVHADTATSDEAPLLGDADNASFGSPDTIAASDGERETSATAPTASRGTNANKVLAEAGLEYLMLKYGLEEVHDWECELSLSEQQRLSIARALFHTPSVVMMDCATSALDEPTEAMVLAALLERRIAVIAVVCSNKSDSPSMTSALGHVQILQLRGDGSWSIANLNN